MLKLRHHVASRRTQDVLEAFFMFFQYKMRYLVVRKRIHYLCEDGIEKIHPSLAITVIHHSASLVMPISDPWDRFFYPTLTLMMD